MPSQYILNRWTKYAKQDIFNSKPRDNDSLEFLFAHVSRKMISLALKCKPSKEVLRHLDNNIDKLAYEACELLSKMSLDENKEAECSSEFNEDVDNNTRVSFQAPIRKKVQ